MTSMVANKIAAGLIKQLLITFPLLLLSCGGLNKTSKSRTGDRLKMFIRMLFLLVQPLPCIGIPYRCSFAPEVRKKDQSIRSGEIFAASAIKFSTQSSRSNALLKSPNCFAYHSTSVSEVTAGDLGEAISFDKQKEYTSVPKDATAKGNKMVDSFPPHSFTQIIVKAD